MAVTDRLSLALKALTLGKDDQSFLDANWVIGLLHATPRRWRRRVALSVLGWSPHYFYRQLQPAGASRGEFLEREFARNRSSRRRIGEQLLGPVLQRTDVVMDYGCGPGFLAHWVAARSRRVYGVDLSRGALLCASALNGAPNAVFLHTSQLDRIPAGAVDVVTSFAVFQHMSDTALSDALAGIRRCLRPGGRLLAHVVIDAAGWRSEAEWRDDASVTGRLRLRYGLNCFSRSERSVRGLIESAGFSSIAVHDLRSTFCDPFDDICSQHLVTAEASQ